MIAAFNNPSCLRVACRMDWGDFSLHGPSEVKGADLI